METRPFIIIGGGGHATVLYWTLVECGKNVMGFIDRNSKAPLLMKRGLNYLGTDEDLRKYSSKDVFLVNGIGSVKSSKPRADLYNRFNALGYDFPEIIHPSAIVGRDCLIGKGAQIMAGAVLQPGCIIGHNCIVNTRVCIDHDSLIGDHSHIASGAVLSGQVQTGTGVHVGAGATIIQCITVGSHSVIGAGAVVVKNVDQNVVVTGVPARQIFKN